MSIASDPLFIIDLIHVWYLCVYIIIITILSSYPPILLAVQ